MLAHKSRMPWRHRTKVKNTQVKSLSQAEKIANAQRRKEKQEMINQKLDEALLYVWKQAELLFEATGTNSVKYWYERLLQRSGKKGHTRRTSRWNAFLSKEMKTRNDGAFSNSTYVILHD